MPQVVEVSPPECDLGRVLTEGEINSGCRYQGVEGRWDRLFRRQFALVAQDDGRFLGLVVCLGYPAEQTHTTEFECP